MKDHQIANQLTVTINGFSPLPPAGAETDASVAAAAAAAEPSSRRGTMRISFEGVEYEVEGTLHSSQGTWRFSGGTGEAQGILGEGSYKGTAFPGGVTYEISGRYDFYFHRNT